MHGITPDALAMSFIESIRPEGEGVRIIANRPGAGDEAEYAAKLEEARQTHHLTERDAVLFLEVRPGDASNFSEFLKIEGKRVDVVTRGDMIEKDTEVLVVAVEGNGVIGARA